MAKAEFGTPKYFANKLKAKGLQKLKYYCQLCDKQCRDANGFKNHIMSPSHTQKTLSIQNPGALIEEYSQQFTNNFLKLLKQNHGTKAVNSNKFYQEIINEKSHVHLNSTKWKSYTSFLKDLQRKMLIKIVTDDDLSEVFNLEMYPIQLVSNSENVVKEKNKKQIDEDELKLQMIKKKIELDKEKQISNNKTVLKNKEKISKPIKLSIKRPSKPVNKKLSQFTKNKS